MKKILLFICLIYNVIAFAQTKDETLVKECISKLFTEMKNSDGNAILESFHDKAILQTITKDGQVKDENLKEFAASISKVGKGKIDEQIEFSSIQIDGDLASVFTPYQFYYEGKLAHCGANSFQLVRKNGIWKIQYLIDTRRKDKCK